MKNVNLTLLKKVSIILFIIGFVIISGCNSSPREERFPTDIEQTVLPYETKNGTYVVCTVIKEDLMYPFVKRHKVAIDTVHKSKVRLTKEVHNALALEAQRVMHGYYDKE